jgi:hypothetical protein
MGQALTLTHQGGLATLSRNGSPACFVDSRKEHRLGHSLYSGFLTALKGCSLWKAHIHF